MIRIEVEYFTEAGLLCEMQRGQGAPQTHLMNRRDYGRWVCEVAEGKPGETLKWRFVVIERTKVVRREAAFHYWTQPEGQNFLLSCLWNEQKSADNGPLFTPHYSLFTIHCRLYTKRRLALCGNTPETGNWDPAKALQAERVGVQQWMFCLSELPVEYKFVLLGDDGQTEWESGYNRTLTLPGMAEEQPRLTEDKFRIAGVVVPVFSLRSEQSWGVGDFGDLCKMIDFAADSGLRIVQLLPVNDTTRRRTWEDSYPYSAISAFALHPIYIDLSDFNGLDDRREQHRIELQRAELNALPQMDYEGALRLKLDYARRYWDENRRELMAAPGLKDFINQNDYWLDAYVCFKVLQDRAHASDTQQWGEHQHFQPKQTQAALRRVGLGRELDFETWMQFCLHKQLLRAHRKAAQRGVMLKGDIPIGVNRQSVETWQYPQYFNFNGQAGAPPDYFAREGQNWGFPTYRWDVILSDGGRWWKERLRVMAQYFDAYRIDHVLGFFRIWEIPYQYVYGTLGHFSPALPLSAKELAECGFAETEMEQYLRAWFTQEELDQLFLKDAPAVRFRFFEHRARNKIWQLRKPYLSQRQILSETLPGRVREGLMNAVCNVLFMPAEGGGYYPNIAGPQTLAFARLKEEQKQAYLHLHSDFFYHRHDEFWVEGAVQKLRLVTEATAMLACAEDLGMIPATMRQVLDRLHCLSLEVESMPKHGGNRFQNVLQNPERSVDTITTHDMPPLRLWWIQNPNDAQAYYNEVLGAQGLAPRELSADLCRRIIDRHLHSPSRLCIIALQDWLAMDSVLRSTNVADEQINKPSVPNHYWRYRMHLTLERLQLARHFQRAIRELVRSSER